MAIISEFLTPTNLWISLVLITPMASFLNYHTSVTLFYGRAVASADMLKITPRGYQDALTNPKYNWLFFLVQLIRLILIVSLFFFGNPTQGVLSIIIVFLIAYSMKKGLLPPPNSRFWLYGLIRTAANREADYMRDGDSKRSEEMKMIKELLINYAITPVEDN